MLDLILEYWANRPRLTHQRWRWLGYALTFGAILYLGYALAQGDLRLDQIKWEDYWLALLITAGLYLLSLLIQFLIWARMISFFRKVSWKDAEIYARMTMMRSIPGGAWHWVGRISMYSGMTDLPTKKVIFGNFLEWSLLILGGIGMYFALDHSPLLRLTITPIIFGSAMALASAWQPKQRGLFHRLWESGVWLALYSIVWILGGSILFLFVQSVSGNESFTWLESLRVWSLSGSMSMLIIFLPSSLGIREISLIWLLQPATTISAALLIALIIRIVFTIADAIWGLLGWLFVGTIQKRSGLFPNA